MQVFLKIKFNSADFEGEVNRIRSVGFECGKHFEDNNYEYYATLFSDEYTYEYAVIDRKRQF